MPPIPTQRSRTGPDPLDWLVAHRGWPARYPENSLAGIRAVLDAGARNVEFDVQLTADGYPVVIHDDHLGRLAGRKSRISRLSREELKGISISGPDRSSAPISGLEEVLALFENRPGVTAFVELKRDSVRRLGRKAAVERVVEAIRKARCRCVFLSFDAAAVRAAQKKGVPETGWAFRPWTFWARWRARSLQPGYLFIRADRIPDRPAPFWPGAWRWVVYRVTDPHTALALRHKGADLIETSDLPGMCQLLSGKTKNGS